MAGSTISSIDTDISKLATTFQTAIKTIIDSESQPLKSVQTQKDNIAVRRAVYADISTNFSSLQSAVQALISTQASYGLSLVPKASVTPGTTGTTVVSATTSDTASWGEYDITGFTGNTGIQLARAESRASTTFASSAVALGKTGTLWLGGTGLAAVSDFTAGTSVNSAGLSSSVLSGQTELGTGKYSVQVRDSDGIRQFRLVNADGTAMSIQNARESGYTSDWQAMPSGVYDTGRGLSLTLNTTGDVGSSDLTYTAKGVSISISSSDTLRNIASKINAASQPEGRDFKASIVSNQLVLTGSQTGENHTLLYSDSSNLLGFGATALQTAQNAKFQVNGMDVSRGSNTGLTDVIDGVTLNLAGDAAGQTAHISVAGSNAKATGLVNTLVSSFNSTLKYITGKLATTSSTDSTGRTTYTRGALAGDTAFSGLRNDLYKGMYGNITNSGSFKHLSDIGLTFDSNMQLTLDSTKFANALQNNPDDVKALLDTSMGSLNTTLSRYTGTKGMLSVTMNSIDEQSKNYDAKISRYNELITSRKKSLYNQYLQYQTTLAELGYEAQQFGVSLNGSTASTINLLS